METPIWQSRHKDFWATTSKNTIFAEAAAEFQLDNGSNNNHTKSTTAEKLWKKNMGVQTKNVIVGQMQYSRQILEKFQGKDKTKKQRKFVRQKQYQVSELFGYDIMPLCQRTWYLRNFLMYYSSHKGFFFSVTLYLQLIEQYWGT